MPTQEPPLGIYVLYLCCPKCRGVISSQESKTPIASDPKDHAPWFPFVTGPGAKRKFPVGHGLKSDCEHTHEVKQ